MLNALFQPHNFATFLWIMSATAVVVFLALRKIDAGYGIMISSKWGPAINNKIAWVLMEAPVFVVMLALWLSSSRRWEVAPMVMCLILELHYFQRSFIFPFMMKGKSKMPLAIMLMGVFFNVLNALMQGGWLFYVSAADRYPISWLWSWQFIVGVIIFAWGMFTNIQSDSIIRHLRKPGDTRHYLPRGGMFRYVTSANYLGEFMEWVGFAVLTWSWAGAVFALWTFANLAPRARRINARYRKEFGEETPKYAIIPGIY